MSLSISIDRTIRCTTCTEEIKGDATAYMLDCGHQFHKSCLQPRLDVNHDTCPLDGKKITSINGIPLYRPESKETVQQVASEGPLVETRGLHQRNVTLIRNPSINSANQMEKTAAKTQALFFSTIGRSQ